MGLAGRAIGRSILNEEDNIDAAAHRRHGRLANRRTREDVFEAIRALRDKRFTYSEIARQTGYKQKQDVRKDLATGMSVSAIARKFATSRQTIMRVRDQN